MEFRCFVFDGQMTAISQYINNVFVEEIGQNAEFIAELILSFFGDLRPMFCYRFAVLDVVVDVEGESVTIIEVNPLTPSAGGSLFSWNMDRRTIQGGCDLWGDLDHWEQHAAGHALVPHKGDPTKMRVSYRLPPFIGEMKTQVPGGPFCVFRFLRMPNPNVSAATIEAMSALWREPSISPAEEEVSDSGPGSPDEKEAEDASEPAPPSSSQSGDMASTPSSANRRRCTIM